MTSLAYCSPLSTLRTSYACMSCTANSVEFHCVYILLHILFGVGCWFHQSGLVSLDLVWFGFIS
ncbi:hypothetical protein BDV19DRAFT_156993 [Aspergillus venezuelensis]